MMTKKPIQLPFEEVMIDIPDVPQLKEIAYSALPHYLLRSEGFYYCGHCGHRYGKAILKTSPFECPDCHTPYTVKYLSKVTNFYNLVACISVSALQKKEGRIAERLYIIKLSVVEAREKIEIFEVHRQTIYKGFIYDFVRYPESTYWRNSLEWRVGYFSYNNYPFKMIRHFKYYPDSMEEFLMDTDFKYSGIGKYLDEYQKAYYPRVDAINWYSMQYMRVATQYPWIEFLYKLGMQKLYDEVLNYRSDMRVIRPTTIKKYRNFIKETNASTFDIICMRLFEKNKISYDFTDISGIQNRKYINDLIDLYKITGMKIRKIREYTEDVEPKKDEEDEYKFSCRKEEKFDKYLDYVNMMVKIGTPPDTDQTAFPKDLDVAHDLAVQKFNATKYERENGTYSKRLEKLLQLEYSENDLLLLIPKSLNEILSEGKILSHCVGSYVDRVAKGDTTIVFVRKSSEPTKPYYTVEYRDGRVMQFYPYKDQITPDRPIIESFLGDWIKFIESVKKPKKVRAAEPGMVTA